MKFKALVGVAFMSFSMQLMAESQPASPLQTDGEKLGYSLGVVMAEQLKPFEGLDAEALFLGVKDVLGNQDIKLERSEMFKLIEAAQQEMEKKRQEKLLEQAGKNLEKGQAFLTENGQKPGVKTLESGLQYRVLSDAKGIKPAETDEVVVHYEGRLLDGKVFDSSYDRGQPATFRLNQVIRGWTEGLKMMPEGAKWELYIPADLAYGPGGIPGRIGPNEVLIFKVELLKVNRPEASTKDSKEGKDSKDKKDKK